VEVFDLSVTEFELSTTGFCEFIDITAHVSKVVKDYGVREGICVVYCPHTTAGITINENADPAVLSDMVMASSKIIRCDDPEYEHGEGNSDGHLKSSFFGASETIIIEDGRLLLGTWQGIYFAEFDGPRKRRVLVKIIAG
jgi:secondary thiamine-phosphate synthase enzyme